MRDLHRRYKFAKNKNLTGWPLFYEPALLHFLDRGVAARQLFGGWRTRWGAPFFSSAESASSSCSMENRRNCASIIAIAITKPIRDASKPRAPKSAMPDSFKLSDNYILRRTMLAD